LLEPQPIANVNELHRIICQRDKYKYDWMSVGMQQHTQFWRGPTPNVTAVKESDGFWYWKTTERVSDED